MRHTLTIRAYEMTGKAVSFLRDASLRSGCSPTTPRLCWRDHGLDHTIVPPGWTPCQDLNHTGSEPDQRADLPRGVIRAGKVEDQTTAPCSKRHVSETLRIMGRATISTDPELCASFAMQGKAPRSVLVIARDQVFFQCAKAIIRSKLWDPSIQVARSSLPTAGTILAEISGGKMGGEEHDRAAPARIKETIY